MASGKQIAGVMVALTIAMVVFQPVATVVGNNSGDVSVTNESVTAQVGEYADLQGYDINSGSVTVYDSGGAEVTENTDYEIAYQNGSVKALSAGNLSDGESITVSYTYAATSGSTTTIIQLIPMFLGLLVLGVLAGKIKGGL